MGNRAATTEMLTAGPENLVGGKKAFGYVRDSTKRNRIEEEEEPYLLH